MSASGDLPRMPAVGDMAMAVMTALADELRAAADRIGLSDAIAVRQRRLARAIVARGLDLEHRNGDVVVRARLAVGPPQSQAAPPALVVEIEPGELAFDSSLTRADGGGAIRSPSRKRTAPGAPSPRRTGAPRAGGRSAARRA